MGFIGEFKNAHYCFNCEAPATDSDTLPGGRVVWICGEPECEKAFQQECRNEEHDAEQWNKKALREQGDSLNTQSN